MEVENTIDIKELIRSKNPRLAKLLPFFVIRYFRRILHEKELNNFFQENKNLQNQEFCSKLLDNLNLKVDIQGIDNIPKNGPVIICNESSFRRNGCCSIDFWIKRTPTRP